MSNPHSTILELLKTDKIVEPYSQNRKYTYLFYLKCYNELDEINKIWYPDEIEKLIIGEF